MRTPPGPEQFARDHQRNFDRAPWGGGDEGEKRITGNRRQHCGRMVAIPESLRLRVETAADATLIGARPQDLCLQGECAGLPVTRHSFEARPGARRALLQPTGAPQPGASAPPIHVSREPSIRAIKSTRGAPQPALACTPCLANRGFDRPSLSTIVNATPKQIYINLVSPVVLQNLLSRPWRGVTKHMETNKKSDSPKNVFCLRFNIDGVGSNREGTSPPNEWPKRNERGGRRRPRFRRSFLESVAERWRFPEYCAGFTEADVCPLANWCVGPCGDIRGEWLLERRARSAG